MPNSEPIVYVVDDDSSAREAIENLLHSVGFRVQTFASGPEFLASEPNAGPACLVLDVRLRGASGIDFQRELAERNITIPVIFITGHGDIPMSVQAMKAGAVEFLEKPFRGQDLLDGIHHGIQRHRAHLEEQSALAELQGRFGTLTPREREVMELVNYGLLNKQIAAELGASERTIKIHRGQVMRKMKAGSLPDLVRMAEKLGLPSRKY